MNVKVKNQTDLYWIFDFVSDSIEKDLRENFQEKKLSHKIPFEGIDRYNSFFFFVIGNPI